MADIAGGGSAPEFVNTVASATGANLSSSLRDWLQKLVDNTQLSAYGPSLFIAALMFLLFVHFVAFVLVNNKGIQGWSRGFDQALFELQVWLQTVVIKLAVYYGFFVIGLYIGSLNSDFMADFLLGMPYVMLVIVLLLLNKVALIFTGVRNPEYTLGPFTGTLTGIFTSSKNKWAYTPTIWLQTVTDIIVQQSVPGALLGYAVGKAVAAVRGQQVFSSGFYA